MILIKTDIFVPELLPQNTCVGYTDGEHQGAITVSYRVTFNKRRLMNRHGSSYYCTKETVRNVGSLASLSLNAISSSTSQLAHTKRPLRKLLSGPASHTVK